MNRRAAWDAVVPLQATAIRPNLHPPRRWTHTDVCTLRSGMLRGEPAEKLAAVLDRTRDEVLSFAQQLRIKAPPG